MKIKGRVSRIFHRMESGFKIVALEVVKGNPIPEKYRNPDYPMSVSVVGNLMNAEEDYIVEIIGAWEYRENGRTGRGSLRSRSIRYVISKRRVFLWISLLV